MRHEVIICTKDRPYELKRCLEALACQEVSADRILIVDSSASIELQNEHAGESKVVHLAAPAGLTIQRNIGLSHLLPDTEVVHFMDDDVVPGPGYLGRMVAAFEDHDAAAGAGGCITNLPTHVPWLIERFFCLNSRHQGTLLKSGINIHSFDGESYRSVDWLSGCCMSYRVDRIQGLRFDERRVGNSLGEDVDFSARARTRGPLIWVPGAEVAHLQSTVNRDTAARVTRRNVAHRWQLAADEIGGVKKGWVVYATIGVIIINLSRALLRRSRSRLLRAQAAALGLLDLMRGGEQCA